MLDIQLHTCLNICSLSMSYVSRRSSRLATALQPRAAGPGLHGDDPHGVAAAGGRSGNLGLYDVSSDILYINVLYI